MIALLALGLIANATGAAATPYPAAAVIDAFKGICGSPASVAAVQSAARSNGWEEFTPGPDSNLGKIVATGKSMAAAILDKTPQNAKIELSALVAFRKSVAGRSLEATVVTAAVAMPGKSATVTGCQIYDFSATAMLPDNAMSSLIDRAPDTKVDYPGQITMYLWNAKSTGPWPKLSVAFAPSTSPLANPARLMVLGLVIKAEQISVIV